MSFLPPAPRSPVGKWLTLFVATAGFVGTLPYKMVPHPKWKGSGTLGTLVGAGLLWLTPPGAATWALGALIFVLSVVTGEWAESYLSHDDPRIVIDEVIGVWVTCCLLPRTPTAFACGIVMFRVFDVWKGPWGHAAARLPGGWGVVADDLLAGVLAWATAAFIYSKLTNF